MSEAVTLHLSGMPELVVRMALLTYRESLASAKKKDEKLGCSTADHDNHDAVTKDLLVQLGWKPKEVGHAEVTRVDPAQLELESPPATPPAPDIPDARSSRAPRPAIVRSQPSGPAVLCGPENDRHRFTPKPEPGKQACPICAKVWYVTISADTPPDVLRCVDYPPDQAPPKAS